VARGEGVGRLSKDSPRTGLGTVGLLSGPLFWLLLFFVLPLFIVAAYSVGLL